MADSLTDATTVPRAIERGEAALATTDDEGELYAIADLIADLLHLAETRGFDADQVLESASTHFHAERI